MFKFALVCHSPTGIGLISRIIELNQINKIKAEYTFFLDPLITEDELKFIKNKEKIKVKFIKVFSIENTIKYSWKIFNEKLFYKSKVNNPNNKRNKIEKINSFNSFSIKKFILTILKIFARLINIFLNSIILLNKRYDYAFFGKETTTSPTTHLFRLLRKKSKKVILIELTNMPDIDYYKKNRKLTYKNKVRPNGLFEKIFPDQIFYKGDNYHLSLWHQEETLSMFLTGVLPRDPLNIIGSLGAQNIICTSKITYEKCKKSKFLKNQTIINSIPLDAELALFSIDKRERIRKDLAKKKSISENKTLILFSISDLAHTNIYSEEESENFQISLIKNIFKITTNCLLIFHPRISPKRFSKLRNLYRNHIVSKSLPNLSSAIDIFMAFGETSAQEYLLPMGIKHIILFKDRMDLYGKYNHFKNLSIFKYNEPFGLEYLEKEIENNFLNENPQYILNKEVVKLSDAIYSICK